MARFFVEYEVRTVGAIGVFWLLGDVIEAKGTDDALKKFRERWGEFYEMRFPARCEQLKETDHAC